jgi:hypothetical protein
MLISATYICPVKGLAGLEPPDPCQLARAAKAAKGLGLDRLLLPVLEESLLGPSRDKAKFLDGLIQALDQVAEAGLTAFLIAPAQRILGLDWAPPYLVRAVRDARAGPVFVDGRVRKLLPSEWWKSMAAVQKRIRIFHELVGAVSGHPALAGWIVFDRALEWSRPDVQGADLVLRSFVAEIKDRDERNSIVLGLGWSELLDPGLSVGLAGHVDGVRISGGETQPTVTDRGSGLGAEILMATYVGTLARWLYERPIQVEIGWGVLERSGIPEDIAETVRALGGAVLAGAAWTSLIDPHPKLNFEPPWGMRHGLNGISLLDHGAEPKEQVETWLRAIRSIPPEKGANRFIDISREEYTAHPRTHFLRLWDHFRESL